MPADPLLTIPQQYQDQFMPSWMHVTQKTESRLSKAVKNVALPGERLRISHLQKEEMDQITTRIGNSNPTEPETYARWLISARFGKAIVLDEWDDAELGTLVAPTSEVMQVLAYAYNRKKDRVIYDALGGNALTGEDGATLTALPSTQIVEETYKAGSASSVNSGLTFGKITRANYILDNNEVPKEGRKFLISPQDEEYLFNFVNEFKSTDFTQNYYTQNGSISGMFWMGFEWIVDTVVSVASNIRNCYAFHSDYVLFGDGQRRASIDILPEKSHALQMRVRCRMNATRKEELGVVQVQTYNV